MTNQLQAPYRTPCPVEAQDEPEEQITLKELALIEKRNKMFLTLFFLLLVMVVFGKVEESNGR